MFVERTPSCVFFVFLVFCFLEPGKEDPNKILFINLLIGNGAKILIGLNLRLAREARVLPASRDGA
jgi:hypothetical protein